jgi:threonylcarbamoyladenosine tRNA methylthiotransferase MtaB
LKYSIVTFGCRVNQADSLGFEEELRAAGAVGAAPEAADLVVVNTCSVTSSADQGARQTIRRIARSNPSARFVVTGCYATRAAEEVRDLPNVVRVVANTDKPKLVSILRASGALTTAERFGDGEGSCGAALEPGVAGRTAFTLRVQTGCAERCSYCIIPETRGAPRSVPVDAVLREAARIAHAGFKEIALTGVHLGSYGRDLSPRSSLIDLLRAIADSEIADACRFRVSSLEPMDCTPELVALVAERACFAHHFHLPLQHASNRMLSAMRRPYAVEQFAALVDRIRSLMPEAAIGSDVIVGFPGETEEDFEALRAYLPCSPLTHLHVFPYSDRPGTDASRLGKRAPGGVVRERARVVREISRTLNDRFHASQAGTVHRALTIEDGSLVVTGNYLKARIPEGFVRNEWVTVRIDADAGPVMAASVVSQAPGS